MNEMPQLNAIMRAICESIEKPVIIVLIFFAACTLVLIGSVIAEALTERRHLKIWMPEIIDEIQKQDYPPAISVRRSGLLKRHKICLIEITDHKDITDAMRESMAIRLLDEVRARYDLIVRCSDLIVKLGPVFGLLGTLIPLGPGIIALGQNDTYTLSTSLLTAFDTTALGLICAGVCTVISMIRKRWYANDMSILETLMECILEVEKQDA